MTLLLAFLLTLLPADSVRLAEVTVSASGLGRTDVGAREQERLATSVVNVVSAVQIERSPDLVVGDALRRVSGVTMERNSAGEGQYALLRGMDKRYNYTTVDGMKIASPEAKNRFVGLDMFPTDLVDRLEVSKSLPADQEGDGVGGAVNIVMMDAPSQRRISLSCATGYSSYLVGHDFESFGFHHIVRTSPNALYGTAFPADATDFGYQNLRVSRGRALPDLRLGASFGDRFFKDRLGVVAALSFANCYKSKTSTLYDQTFLSSGAQDITDRTFSEQQTRTGVHVLLDLRPAEGHVIRWHNSLFDYRNAQVRQATSDQEQTYRLRWTHQLIACSALRGEHFTQRPVQLLWRLGWTRATSETPDNALITLNNNSGGAMQWVSKSQGMTRRWENNTDRDWTGGLSLRHASRLAGGKLLQAEAGALLREKHRTSYYAEYAFQPWDDSKPDTERQDQIAGEDFNTFDEVSWRLSGRALSDPLNYTATERIAAAYAMLGIERGRWKATGGLRAEYTKQGYSLLYATTDAESEGLQRYTDPLPSLNVRYRIKEGQQLRASYYRAINRPSFFEIVPYHIVNEDYSESGNPDLQHTVVDNFDVRWEFYPKAMEQIMVGLFFKRLKNPIDNGMVMVGQAAFYTPTNYGDANNMGAEVDVTKYFGPIGVRANYTYTHSRISTTKVQELTDANGTVYTQYALQSRPLYGQAAHVCNATLLYRHRRLGIDAQVGVNYTGKRIAVVDRLYDNDRWDAGMTQLDCAVEKSFAKRMSVYLKATNLLNSPLVRYYHTNSTNEALEGVRRCRGGVVERVEHTGQTLTIGFRLKL